jgi:Flp pilus assembly protein TadG
MRSSKGSERGAVVVEFALVLPIFLILVFGVIEFGWAFSQQLDVRHGAREGARLAAVNHGHYDESDNERTPSAQTTALVTEICSRMDRDGEAVVTISGGGDVGDETEVTVLRELDTLTGFFDGWLGGREIESTVSMRTEQDATWQVATAADCPEETT